MKPSPRSSGSIPTISAMSRGRPSQRSRWPHSPPSGGLESSFDVAQDAFEDRLPIPIDGVPIGPPRPVRTKMTEEAALRVRLHAEHVPVPIAQGREVERGPARVPRVSGVLPAVVDETEHDLIVVDQLFQDPLLAVLREQEFAFCVRGDEGDDLALLQGPGEGARTRVLHPKQAGPALVVARGARAQDRP